jgi:hypothetical protein
MPEFESQNISFRRPGPGRLLILSSVAVSKWVACVPGLFWLPGSNKTREVHPSQIESESEAWTTYTPGGKSRKVSGGG